MLRVSVKEAGQAVNRVASTEDGKILLYMLQRDCGFMRNLMSMDDPNQTQVFAAKRGVWAHFRNYIDKKHRVDIENNVEVVNDAIKKDKG